MMMTVRALPLVPALAALALAFPAWSQHSVSVPVELEHLSNPSLVAESPGSVTLLRVSPRYEFDIVDDARRHVLALGASFERSSNTALAASRNNPLVDYRLEIGSPLSMLTFRAGLEEASSRVAEFRDFGRVTVDSTQRTVALSTAWRRELAPTTGLTMEAGHSRVSYDSELLSGYRENVLAATVTRQQSERANWHVETRLARLEPGDDGDASTRIGLAVGYESAVSDALTLRGSVGVVRVRPAGGSEPVANIGLAYEAERLSLDLGLAREVGAIGTEGRYAMTDTVQGTLSYPLTPNTTLSAGASHARTKDLLSERGTSVFLRSQTELSQFWTLGLAVEQRRSRPQGLPSARSHGLGLTLSYSHPNF